jgi:ketosteroid isomerase-like protein
MASTTTAELVALEEQFWRDAGDLDFYRANVVESVVMVFPPPFGVMTGDRLLDAVAQASPWTEVELSEVEVVELGDTAIVAYRVRAKRGGGDPYVTYAGSAYVRSGGAWKLALHQQTPIVEG